MKNYVLNAVLLLIASSHLVGSAQDAAKTVAPKTIEKPAVAASKPDDKKIDTKPEVKKVDDKNVEKKKSTNRLPSNYGKLSLTDAQKAKVYGIQDKHEAEIDGLTEKLKAAKSKESAEIEGILTPEQKKKLKEITAAKDDEKTDIKGKN